MAQTAFIRGDTNADGTVDIAEALELVAPRRIAVGGEDPGARGVVQAGREQPDGPEPDHRDGFPGLHGGGAQGGPGAVAVHLEIGVVVRGLHDAGVVDEDARPARKRGEATEEDGVMGYQAQTVAPVPNSLAVDFNGILWAWGQNADGQRGDGTRNVHSYPGLWWRRCIQPGEARSR